MLRRERISEIQIEICKVQSRLEDLKAERDRLIKQDLEFRKQVEELKVDQ